MVFVSMDPDINLEQKIKRLNIKNGQSHSSQQNTPERRRLEGSRDFQESQGTDLIWDTDRYHINATSDGGVGPTSIRAAWEKKFQPEAREGELGSHL